MNATSKAIFIGKRTILSLFILIGAVNCASAQEFALGIKAGPLTSWSVYGDKDDGDAFKSKLTFGFHGAGILTFPLGHDYTCVIEGGYSQHGRNIEFNSGFGRNKSTYYFTDAALLLRRSFKVQIHENIPGNVFVNIGPHINYWLGGKGRVGTSEGDGSPYTVVFNQEVDLGQFDKMFLNDVNRWMFGIDIGVGIDAPINRTQKVLVELRFTSGHTFYGQRNSASYSWVEFEDNMRANEKVLSLTAAYMFGFNIQESKKGRSTKDKEVHRKPVKKKRRK